MKKKKTHRHKWLQQCADCPFCGFGMYLECEECGEIRDMDKKPLK